MHLAAALLSLESTGLPWLLLALVCYTAVAMLTLLRLDTSAALYFAAGSGLQLIALLLPLLWRGEANVAAIALVIVACVLLITGFLVQHTFGRSLFPHPRLES